MSLNDLFGKRRAELGIEPEQPYKAPLTLFADDKRDPEFMGKAAKWAHKALHGRAATLNAMEVGDGKNNYLNKSTWVLLRFALAGHLDVQEVIDVMGEADGGGEYPATRSTLRSAYQAALKHGPADPPVGLEVSADDFFEQLVDAVRPAAEPVEAPEGVDAAIGEVTEMSAEDIAAAWSAKVRAALPVLDWHALWADESEEDWIIEPILPARRLIALYSLPKMGKSLLLLELCCAIATGRDVLGVSIDRPRRVLYVDFENDPKGDVRERLKAMGYGPDDLENLYYLSFPTLASLDSERGGAELMAAVAEYQCEVVVVDTVSRAVAGEENENDTWLAFYRHTGLLMKQQGIALIRLDHAGKDESKGQRGGSAKSGDVDAVWRLSKVTDDTFRLDCEAARMMIHEKTLVLHRKRDPLRHQVDAAGKSATFGIKVAAYIATLDAVGVPDDASQAESTKALRAAGQKVTTGGDPIKEAVRRRSERSEMQSERWSE